MECAAIATRFLGRSFDVQAGGSDLIFPHHEMSAAHARAAFGAAAGEVYARRYAHSGMVRLDGEKMSKSLGNLVFVSQLRESGTDPMAIRLAILAHHYRQDWDWTGAVLTAATTRLDRWRTAVRAGLRGPGGVTHEPGPARQEDQGPDQASSEVLAAIRERLSDDLDAPGALAVVDSWAEMMLAGAAADPAAHLAGSTRLVRDAVDARAVTAKPDVKPRPVPVERGRAVNRGLNQSSRRAVGQVSLVTWITHSPVTHTPSTPRRPACAAGSESARPTESSLSCHTYSGSIRTTAW